MTMMTAYLLFVLSNNSTPALTSLATFPSEDACKVAATVVTAALSAGEGALKVVCISADSLQELGKVNGFMEE